MVVRMLRDGCISQKSYEFLPISDRLAQVLHCPILKFTSRIQTVICFQLNCTCAFHIDSPFIWGRGALKKFPRVAGT